MAEGIFVFVLGLIFGSFINAVLWRLHSGKSTLLERSQCVYCAHKLGLWDLFPIVSFLWLKGKCRYCRERISWQYPAIELSTALGFLGIYLSPENLHDKVFLGGIFFLWTLIFAYDLRHFLIPDSFILVSAIWIFGGLVLFHPENIKHGIIAGAGISAFFLLLYFISKGKWIGGGDVKFGFMLGLWLGWPLGVLALFLAYIIGAVAGVALIGFKKLSLKSQVPFGPFLIAGSMVAYFFGNQMIDWYLNLF